MKYIKYFVLSILLLPICVSAYEFTCPDGVYQYGDSFSCIIKGNNNVNYDLLTGSLEENSASVLKCSVEKLNNGLENNEEVDKDSSFSYKGTNNTEELVKYNCTVATKPSTSNIETLVISEFKYDIADDNKNPSVEVLRSNGISIQEYIEDKPAETKPRDTSNPSAIAKNIIINGDANIFTFSAYKTVYNIEVKYELSTANLVVIPNDEAATYEIQGNTQLEVGMNIIDVYITSPDQTKKTCYTLNINRLKRGEDIYYPEKNTDLSELKIEGFNINFEPVIQEYKIHLKYDVDSVKITAVAKESGSKVVISNTSNLHNGSTIEVKVICADGSDDKTYTIHVTKDSPPKDYRNLIYGGIIVTALVLVTAIIIITNTKNKNNPLLRKKEEKNVDVPPVDNTQGVVTQVNPPQVVPTEPNTSQVVPTQTDTTQVVPTEQVVPTPVPQPEIQVPTPPQPVVMPTPQVPQEQVPAPMPQVEVQQPVQNDGTIPPQQ